MVAAPPHSLTQQKNGDRSVVDPKASDISEPRRGAFGRFLQQSMLGGVPSIMWVCGVYVWLDRYRKSAMIEVRT